MSIRKYLKFFYDKDIDIIEFKDIVLLKNEYFVELKTSYYPEIRDNMYMISNKGRIYSNISKKFLKYRTTKNGYPKINLQCIISDSNLKSEKTYTLHRLLMLIFKPTENMENLVVNHLDGNKLNFDLNNMEWVTSKENSIHAINTGLYKPNHGENASSVSINKKIVKKICKLYMSGKYKQYEIAELCNTTKSIVESIVHKKAWVRITKKYDFSKRKDLSSSIYFSNKEIHQICKLLEKTSLENFKSKRSLYKYVIKNVKNINIDEISDKMLDVLRGIYEHRYFTNISSKYNF